MNKDRLSAYSEVAGKEIVDQLKQLAKPLKGAKVIHVNSTREGGGVAEILHELVPLMQELGIDTSWEVIKGKNAFFDVTKKFHNGIQGERVPINWNSLRVYEQVNEENAGRLRRRLEEADFVFIHDPQPAMLLNHCTGRKGKWIWRCHIDASRPHRPVWEYLRKVVGGYDASIFSLADFAQRLPHTQYLIPPSIDPFNAKNVALGEDEISAARAQFNLDPDRPLIVQVSRYDRFKDPVGVIEAYRLTKKFVPSVQLVLAGGGASDDPEGQVVLDEVIDAASNDPDIHVLLLPPDAHTTINALQRAADVVVQKSLKEGFGLTVTEALWKGKPVIGGNTGGIRLQVVNHHTGFLVDTPKGAALRIRYLLYNKDRAEEMGNKGRQFVRENFLLTRQLRDYMTLMVGLTHGKQGRINLD